MTRTPLDAPAVPRRRIVLASMVDTSIEFFDFYIYATAAVLVFPTLFFPKGNDTAALLSSFATFWLAFVARPVGSMLFGHFDDRIGRKATLVGSLMTMGVATFAIGLLPTFDAVGYWAPALLALLRFARVSDWADTAACVVDGQGMTACLLHIGTTNGSRDCGFVLDPKGSWVF